MPDQWGNANAPFALIANEIYGFGSAFLVVCMGLFIVAASALAFVWGGSNLCYSLADQHALPQWLLKQRNNVNYTAIIFLWVIYTVAFLFIYLFDIGITQLAACVGASTLITYAICGLAYFRLIKTGRVYAVCTLLFSCILLPYFRAALLYPVLTVILYFIFIFVSKRLKW